MVLLDDLEPQPQRTWGPSEHLQWVVSSVKPNLSTKEAQKMGEFISEFQDIFATESDDYGQTDKLYHHTDTSDAHPIHQHPNRLLLAKQAEVNEILKNMEERGVIEESDSPWSLPIMLDQNKNGNLRFCMRHRKLNDVTKKECFPPLRINDTLDLLARGKWF
jgi:hypothetical protein